MYDKIHYKFKKKKMKKKKLIQTHATKLTPWNERMSWAELSFYLRPGLAMLLAGSQSAEKGQRLLPLLFLGTTGVLTPPRRAPSAAIDTDNWIVVVGVAKTAFLELSRVSPNMVLPPVPTFNEVKIIVLKVLIAVFYSGPIMYQLMYTCCLFSYYHLILCSVLLSPKNQIEELVKVHG